jgi:hypothetical protein
MPRVPVYDSPRVSIGDAYPAVAPRQVQPDMTAARLLESGERALGVAASVFERSRRQSELEREKARQQMEAEAERARKEADAVAEAAAMMELDGRAVRRLGEFRRLRGLEASQASADVFDSFEADRQEIAQSIGSESARAAFLARSATAVMGYRREVESHVWREFEAAREATLKARIEQAVGLAEAGADEETWRRVSADVEQEISAMARTPEEAAAMRAEFYSQNNAAAITGLLAQGRLEDAKKALEEARPNLGRRYAEVAAAVKRAEEGAQREHLANEAAKLVDGSAEAVRNADGYVFERDLRRAVPLEQYDVEMRQRVEAELQRRIALERRKLELDIAQARDTFAKSDGRDGTAESFLEKYDYDWLMAWRARRKAEAERARLKREGTQREKAAAAARQRAVDAEFLWTLKRRLLEDPSTKPEDVLTEFIAEKAKGGEIVTVSPVTMAEAAFHAADVQKKTQTKEGVEELRARQSFADDIEAALRVYAKAKGKPVDQQQLATWVGKAIATYDERVRANGGRPLDVAQVAALKAELTTLVDVEVPGRWWGTNTVKRPAVDVVDAGTQEVLPGGVAEPPAAPSPPAVRVRGPDGRVKLMPANKVPEKLPPGYEVLP